MPDAPESMSAPFVPVIPAGGAGTRLWPLSRRDRPKFLLDVAGSGRTLLEGTLDRLVPLADRAPIIVTGRAHAQAVREQAGRNVRIVAEPSPRSSMPAIALAAALIDREDPEAVIGSFAADHVVRDVGDFARCVHEARRAAALGYLVTIGITPTSPATGFGYIEEGTLEPRAEHAEDSDALAPLEGTGALPVRRFVEKPDAERAARFLATGRFRWNAGMFVVRARVLLDALSEQIPPMAAGVREIAAAHGGPREQEVLEEVWPRLTTIAIDHALAEPLAAAGRVAVVPGAFGWDDVGDFTSLTRLARENAGLDAGRTGVLCPGGAQAVGIDADGTVHGPPDRLVALVGVHGVSVALTEDAVLVVADESAQKVGELGAELDRRGRGDLR